MYENRHITEPKWKSWLIQTTTPLFTPDQCRQIIESGRRQAPQNGRLQILGSASGQFANVDYQPQIKERDFYIFPYDMRHAVYPFNGPGMRRTLAANMDVEYNPIKNRGVS